MPALADQAAYCRKEQLTPIIVSPSNRTPICVPAWLVIYMNREWEIRSQAVRGSYAPAMHNQYA
jgi:hypothetical protein